MKIGFANQKGGVGKTTLTILFADYLRKSGLDPLCLDFDPQGSLYHRWELASDLSEDEPKTHVIRCEMAERGAILREASKTDQIILFDLPGSLEQPGIQDVLEALDLIVCPFLYEPISFESSHVFAQIMSELGLGADMVFVPNMVKSRVRYDIRKKVDKELGEFGNVAPLIKDLVNMQRIDFFNIAASSRSNVEKTFFFIVSKYVYKR